MRKIYKSFFREQVGELEKVSNNEGEGEAARYFSHAITLKETIVFLRQNSAMQLQQQHQESTPGERKVAPCRKMIYCKKI